MNESGRQPERRSEVRGRAPAERIAWAREDATRTNAGWVNDVAESGIAFVTPARDRPSPGELIELTFDPGGPSPRHRLVRVARIAPYDRFFSVVGCRNNPAENRSAKAL